MLSPRPYRALYGLLHKRKKGDLALKPSSIDLQALFPHQ